MLTGAVAAQAEVVEFTTIKEFAVSAEGTSFFSTPDAIRDCAFQWKAAAYPVGTIFRAELDGSQTGLLLGKPTTDASVLKSFGCSWVRPQDPFTLDELRTTVGEFFTITEVK